MSELIDKIASEIEVQFGKGHPSTWGGQLIKALLYDMEDKLSDIFKNNPKKAIACGVFDVEHGWTPINLTTFQRIFITKTTKTPKPITLNAFCIYLGYENIEDFQLKQNVIKKPKTIKSVYFNFPKRPPYFKGREESITTIHENLIDDKFPESIILISGVGGIGKTTLVHEYMNRSICQSHFKHIIYSSVNKNLENAFIRDVALFFDIDLKIYPKHEEQIQVIIQTLKKTKGNNLIVIDNINEHDRADLERMKSIFEQTGWCFLVTTRTTPDIFFSVQLEELPISEAAQIFAYHYLPSKIPSVEAINKLIEKEQEGIKALLIHVYKHTLLIELLGKVGLKRGLKIPKLLEFLKKEDEKYKGIGFQKDGLQKTISIGEHAKSRHLQSRATIHHYILSLFEPEKLNESGQTMVRFFSVLPSEDLPIEDLKILWQVSKEEEIQFEDRLDDLQQSGWFGVKYHQHDEVTIQNLSYKMHPLVQDVVYEKLTPNINNIRPLVKTITQVLSTPLKHPHKYQGYAKSVIDKLNFLHFRKKEPTN